MARQRKGPRCNANEKPAPDPTKKYFVVVKSPRSGSTFLHKAMAMEPSFLSWFEPERGCVTNYLNSCKYNACGVSLNDYLKSSGSFKEVNNYLEAYNATLIIQLRLDVLGKALSITKMPWGPKIRSNADMEKFLLFEVSRAVDTIVGHLYVARQYPQFRPLVIWHEDLTEHCEATLERMCAHVRVACSPAGENGTNVCASFGAAKRKTPDILARLEVNRDKLPLPFDMISENRHRDVEKLLWQRADEKNELMYNLWR
ncbi:hypothetical protein RI054_16g77680 [Pseudoscourfieldia marina]